MNEEAKKESGVVGKAVKTAGVVGAGYLAHKGLRSDAAYNWAAANGDNIVAKGVTGYNKGMDKARDTILKNRQQASGVDPNVIENVDFTVGGATNAQGTPVGQSGNRPRYNKNQITSGGQHALEPARTETIMNEVDSKTKQFRAEDAKAERLNKAKNIAKQQTENVETQLRQQQLNNLKKGSGIADDVVKGSVKKGAGETLEKAVQLAFKL